MRTAREAEKTRHDARPMSTPISIGTRVLLRKCAFDGRHKLVDKFEREPYIVTSVNKAGDVYRIRPLFGGPTKTVNRRLLIPDPRTDGQPLVTGPEPESTPRSHDRGQINKEKDQPTNHSMMRMTQPPSYLSGTRLICLMVMLTMIPSSVADPVALIRDRTATLPASLDRS